MVRYCTSVHPYFHELQVRVSTVYFNMAAIHMQVCTANPSMFMSKSIGRYPLKNICKDRGHPLCGGESILVQGGNFNEKANSYVETIPPYHTLSTFPFLCTSGNPAFLALIFLTTYIYTYRVTIKQTSFQRCTFKPEQISVNLEF